MRIHLHRGVAQVLLVVALGWLGPLAASAATTNSLHWNKEKDLVDADVRNIELWPLLENIAGTTGWHIFVEPDCARTASVKFKNLPSGEALRLLLGDLNFAFVPQGEGAARLYVFRTSMEHATQYVQAFKAAAGAKRVPNQLIVKLKPGGNIDALARKLGAKVVGRLEGADVYLLQFDNAAAADAAFAQLALDADVAGVDYNYYIDRPMPMTGATSGSAGLPQLTLNPPPSSGRTIIGLIDQPVQALCGNLGQFVLNPISVVGDSPPPSDNAPTHGTAMVNAIMQGLAASAKGGTSVQILPVDVYGSNPTTSTFSVASGIVQAINHGATVINLSLGGAGDSTLLQSLIQNVHSRGIPIFAAAGNEPVTTPYYPAAYPGVVAVTATDQGKIASYANRGSFVALAAPGSEVFCYGGQSYLAKGTSSATAYATGWAAGTADSSHLSWGQVETQMQGVFQVPSGN